MNRLSLPGTLLELSVCGGGAESLDDCSNIFSLLPREPDPAGGGGRDVELGPEEKDGGAAKFDDLLFIGGGPALASMAIGAVGGARPGVPAQSRWGNDYMR